MKNLSAEYIDHMGTDLRVVNAARVSFNKESSVLSLPDEKLIGFLSRGGHFTPFTHCIITMRETIPIFVARQRFKHTVGFSYNEMSRRYVTDEPDFFVPKEWRQAAANVKQGSSAEIVEYMHGTGSSDYDETITEHVKRHNDESVHLYNALLDRNVCAEQARMVLPAGSCTSFYVTGSLAAWARAYNLRIEGTAQKEIQDLALQWNDIIEPLFPISWKALTQEQE